MREAHVYARIARFEGADPARMQEIADGIKAETGPPEGVPATRFMLLLDRSSGTSLGISFFESEEDMRTGDRALNEMSPPADATGRRASVEFYEVAVELPP
jgi:hypothetical protein